MGDLNDLSLKAPFSIIFRMAAPVTFVFPFAPQMVDNDFPSRGSINQTLADNFVNDFSGKRSVLARVTLQGTFGYRISNGGLGIPAFGSLHLKTLETAYETYNALSRQTKKAIDARQEYINLSRLHYWRIRIESFRYKADKSDPLLSYYTIVFHRLQDYLSPVGPSIPGLSAAGLSSAASNLASLF